MSAFRVTVVTALALLSTGAHAQESTSPLRVTGFVESAYAYSSRDLDRRIVGNLYLPRHDELALNAANIKVERLAPSDVTGTGFTIEAMAGTHASAVRAAGLDLGPYADVVQAYGVLGFPDTRLQVSVGKMATMLGYEVIQSTVNPNLSVGNQYVFVENFTDLGVDVSWTGTSGWSARARVVNGWDVVADNNEDKSVFGKIAWSRDANGVAVFGYTGSELPDSVGGHRSGVELIANTKLANVTTILQLDAGREEALDADWRAAGLWLVVPLREGLDLALRGDVLDDSQGARTSGALGFPTHTGQTLYSGTATLAVRSIAGALIRPELRYDRSDLPVFDGAEDQWTFALGAALTF
jgi:hypothetical protein